MVFIAINFMCGNGYGGVSDDRAFCIAMDKLKLLTQWLKSMTSFMDIDNQYIHVCSCINRFGIFGNCIEAETTSTIDRMMINISSYQSGLFTIIILINWPI